MSIFGTENSWTQERLTAYPIPQTIVEGGEVLDFEVL